MKKRVLAHTVLLPRPADHSHEWTFLGYVPLRTRSFDDTVKTTWDDRRLAIEKEVASSGVGEIRHCDPVCRLDVVHVLHAINMAKLPRDVQTRIQLDVHASGRDGKG